jgi:hypothetical protein
MAIYFDGDCAGVFIIVISDKGDAETIAQNFRRNISPFNKANRSHVEQLTNAKICHFSQTGQPIQIYMVQWNAT